MKKFRLLKKIESDNSLELGSIFNLIDEKFVSLSNGHKIPTKWLIEHGYIEEIEERNNLRLKVGDKVVVKDRYFTTIGSITKPIDDTDNEIYSTLANGGLTLQRDIRRPTEEELKLYFN